MNKCIIVWENFIEEDQLTSKIAQLFKHYTDNPYQEKEEFVSEVFASLDDDELIELVEGENDKALVVLLMGIKTVFQSDEEGYISVDEEELDLEGTNLYMICTLEALRRKDLVEVEGYLYDPFNDDRYLTRATNLADFLSEDDIQEIEEINRFKRLLGYAD